MPSSAGGAEVSPSMAPTDGVARERVSFTPHPKTLTGGGEYDSFASHHPFVYALMEFIDNSIGACWQSARSPEIEIGILQARARQPPALICVQDNGRGMTREQLNDWAVLHYSVKDRAANRQSQDSEAPGQGAVPGGAVPLVSSSTASVHQERYLRGNISRFGVGSKNATFFVCRSIKIATRAAGEDSVHELTLSADELERRYKLGLAVYEADMVHRAPGNASTLSSTEEAFADMRRRVEAERQVPRDQGFTRVLLSDLKPEIAEQLSQDAEGRELCREFAHAYHYYIHGPGGNRSGDLPPLPGVPRLRLELCWHQDAHVLWRTDLASVTDDLETRMLRQARDSFPFRLDVPGKSRVAGLLHYYPTSRGRESVPHLDEAQSALRKFRASAMALSQAAGEGALAPAPSGDAVEVEDEDEDEEGSGLVRAPIFEVYWEGRLIPAAVVESLDFIDRARPKKKELDSTDALTDEAFMRLRGTLFVDASFKVTKNKLMFAQPLAALLSGSQGVPRALARDFKEWLTRCHRTLDRSWCFSGLLEPRRQAELRRLEGENYTAFERVCHASRLDHERGAARDGEVEAEEGMEAEKEGRSFDALPFSDSLTIARGGVIRLATKPRQPPLVGEVQFLAAPLATQRAEADAAGGLVFLRLLPRALHRARGRGPSDRFPLRRVQAALSDGERAAFEAEELRRRMPALLRLEWTAGGRKRVVENELWADEGAAVDLRQPPGAVPCSPRCESLLAGGALSNLTASAAAQDGAEVRRLGARGDLHLGLELWAARDSGGEATPTQRLWRCAGSLVSSSKRMGGGSHAFAAPFPPLKQAGVYLLVLAASADGEVLLRRSACLRVLAGAAHGLELALGEKACAWRLGQSLELSVLCRDRHGNAVAESQAAVELRARNVRLWLEGMGGGAGPSSQREGAGSGAALGSQREGRSIAAPPGLQLRGWAPAEAASGGARGSVCVVGGGAEALFARGAASNRPADSEGEAAPPRTLRLVAGAGKLESEPLGILLRPGVPVGLRWADPPPQDPVLSVCAGGAFPDAMVEVCDAWGHRSFPDADCSAVLVAVSPALVDSPVTLEVPASGRLSLQALRACLPASSAGDEAVDAVLELALRVTPASPALAAALRCGLDCRDVQQSEAPSLAGKDGAFSGAPSSQVPATPLPTVAVYSLTLPLRVGPSSRPSVLRLALQGHLEVEVLEEGVEEAASAAEQGPGRGRKSRSRAVAQSCATVRTFATRLLVRGATAGSTLSALSFALETGHGRPCPGRLLGHWGASWAGSTPQDVEWAGEPVALPDLRLGEVAGQTERAQVWFYARGSEAGASEPRKLVAEVSFEVAPGPPRAWALRLVRLRGSKSRARALESQEEGQGGQVRCGELFGLAVQALDGFHNPCALWDAAGRALLALPSVRAQREDGLDLRREREGGWGPWSEEPDSAAGQESQRDGSTRIPASARLASRLKLRLIGPAGTCKVTVGADALARDEPGVCVLTPPPAAGRQLALEPDALPLQLAPGPARCLEIEGPRRRRGGLRAALGELRVRTCDAGLNPATSGPPLAVVLANSALEVGGGGRAAAVSADRALRATLRNGEAVFRNVTLAAEAEGCYELRCLVADRERALEGASLLVEARAQNAVREVRCALPDRLLAGREPAGASVELSVELDTEDGAPLPDAVVDEGLVLTLEPPRGGSRVRLLPAQACGREWDGGTLRLEWETGSLSLAGTYAATARFAEAREEILGGAGRGPRVLASTTKQFRLVVGPPTHAELLWRDARPPSIIAVSDREGGRRLLPGACVQLCDAWGNPACVKGLRAQLRLVELEEARACLDLMRKRERAHGTQGGAREREDAADEAEDAARTSCPPLGPSERLPLLEARMRSTTTLADPSSRALEGATDLQGRWNLGRVSVAAGSGSAPDRPLPLALLLRVEGLDPSPRSLPEPAPGWAQVWAHAAVFAGAGERFDPVRLAAEERGDLERRVGQSRERARVAQGRVAALGAAAEALEAASERRLAGAIRLPPTLVEARRALREARRRARGADAEPSLTAPEELLLPARFGRENLPAAAALHAALRSSDPGVLGVLAQLATAGSEALGRVLAAQYGRGLATLAVEDMAARERVLLALRAARQERLPDVFPLSHTGGYRGGRRAAVPGLREAGEVAKAMAAEAVAGGADALLPQPLPHVRHMPGRGADGEGLWAEGCLGYAFNLVRPTRPGVRARILYALMGSVLVFDTLENATSYREMVCRQLRGGLPDLITLDGKRFTSKGVVSGESFRVVPLQDAEYRFGRHSQTLPEASAEQLEEWVANFELRERAQRDLQQAQDEDALAEREAQEVEQTLRERCPELDETLGSQALPRPLSQGASRRRQQHPVRLQRDASPPPEDIIVDSDGCEEDLTSAPRPRPSKRLCTAG